jgi:mannose-6-phosphate isomerase-like protein (cupin superfamily)
MNQGQNLQSGCFVVHQDELSLQEHGSIKWAQVIGCDDEARKLSFFYLEVGQGKSPAIYLGEEEAVLYLQTGQCSISICDRAFDTQAGTGVHVRQGEQFSFVNHSGESAKWLLSICPRVEGLNFDAPKGSDTPQPTFTAAFPARLVSRSEQKSEATGDRFYKLLVGLSVGSDSVTQFIGGIPPSKAPDHFHLYEEVICILTGHGRMWNEDLFTEIKPGSMIFLPRKQPHSLECLDENGMELMGVFYPAGSPAINYKIEKEN